MHIHTEAGLRLDSFSQNSNRLHETWALTNIVSNTNLDSGCDIINEIDGIVLIADDRTGIREAMPHQYSISCTQNPNWNWTPRLLAWIKTEQTIMWCRHEDKKLPPNIIGFKPPTCDDIKTISHFRGGGKFGGWRGRGLSPTFLFLVYWPLIISWSTYMWAWPCTLYATQLIISLTEQIPLDHVHWIPIHSEHYCCRQCLLALLAQPSAIWLKPKADKFPTARMGGWVGVGVLPGNSFRIHLPLQTGRGTLLRTSSFLRNIFVQVPCILDGN